MILTGYIKEQTTTNWLWLTKRNKSCLVAWFIHNEVLAIQVFIPLQGRINLEGNSGYQVANQEVINRVTNALGKEAELQRFMC